LAQKSATEKVSSVLTGPPAGTTKRQGAVSTVLIVDDDGVTRESLAGWFRTAGWQVRTATGCKEALEQALAGMPDHAIIEQRLADGSGLDLLCSLSAIRPGLSSIVLTRYPSVAAAVHAIRLGFRDYLPKPVAWERLSRLFGLPVPTFALPCQNDVSSDASPSLARIEWEHIEATMLACQGNISAAARRLRIHRRSLQRKLQRGAPR
jgi:two-component system response regulator RegA